VTPTNEAGRSRQSDVSKSKYPNQHFVPEAGAFTEPFTLSVNGVTSNELSPSMI
jgi:hypothetical protein